MSAAMCARSPYGVRHGAQPAHPDGGIRRRPKDRKAQIARASAEAFSALGYHTVSMEAIASRGPGSRRPRCTGTTRSKYDLFRDAVLALGEQLVNCTAFADEAPADAGTLRLGSSPRSPIPHWPTASRVGSTGGRRGICAATTRPPSTARCEPSIAGFIGRSAALRPELTSRQRWILSSSMLRRDRQHRRSPRQASRHPHSCSRWPKSPSPSRPPTCLTPPDESVPGRPGRRMSGVDPSKYEALLTESVCCSTGRATGTPPWRRSRRRLACQRRGSTDTSPVRATSSPRYTGGRPIGCRPRRRSILRLVLLIRKRH